MSSLTLHSGLLLAIAGVLPVYLWRFSVLGIPTNALEMLILAALVVGLTSAPVRLRWRRATRALAWEIKLLVLLFILSAVISTLISPHLHTSLGILKGWILLPILYGWMIYGYVQTEAQARTYILDALTLSTVAVSLFGLTQIGTLERITSVYDVPNSLALFVTPVLAATIWRAVTGRAWWLWVAAAVMFAAVIASQTLGAYLAFVGALLISGVWSRHSISPVVRKGFVAALLGVVVIGGVFIWGKVEYLASPQSSAAVRLQLWSVSWDLVQEHPFLGTGLGTFEPVYQQKLHERFGEYEEGVRGLQPLPEFVFRDPHNWVLSFWLNVGLPGLLSFGALLWIVVRRSWKAHFPIYLMFMAIFLLGLVDTMYWKNDIALVVWLTVGIASSSKQ